MERRIGEIFEFNGEWYQCVEVGQQCCSDCAFHKLDSICHSMKCSLIIRSDETSVIFKKLEKVGKPFSCNYYGDTRLVMMQEYQLFDLDMIYSLPMYITDYKHKRIAIEIKQTKEDMSNTETLWYGPDKKEAKSLKLSNLKPFSLEAAKAGKPVCTRDGRKARIICFDRKFYHDGYNYPIVAMVNDNDNELVHAYTQDGLLVRNMEGDLDLMMLPEKKEGWVNIYKDSVYDTKDEALIGRSESRGYIDTVKINWEE